MPSWLDYKFVRREQVTSNDVSWADCGGLRTVPRLVSDARCPRDRWRPRGPCGDGSGILWGVSHVMRALKPPPTRPGFPEFAPASRAHPHHHFHFHHSPKHVGFCARSYAWRRVFNAFASHLAAYSPVRAHQALAWLDALHHHIRAHTFDGSRYGQPRGNVLVVPSNGECQPSIDKECCAESHALQYYARELCTMTDALSCGSLRAHPCDVSSSCTTRIL